MTQFHAMKNRIQQKVTPEEYEWIQNRYLPQISRTGAQAKGTQAKYLQSLEKIADDLQTPLTEIKDLSKEELKELNREIADKIQSSHYRRTEGENVERRKRQQWTTWKKILETHSIPTNQEEKHIPQVKFTEKTGEVKRQADTKPEDLPTPSQVKQFIREIGYVSQDLTKIRNQALASLLWDKGPRIGEALQIQIKHVSVNGDRLHITIPGNKGSETRKVEVFQGKKLLKQLLEKHPATDEPEAYLFCSFKEETFKEKLDVKPLRRKWHQARSSADLDFKTSGEPFHIFRKAMVTSHVVNEWATWEQICTWHGKGTDSTKPDYLKMALSDVDASVAEKMGVSDGADRVKSNRMIGEPLLPRECRGCGYLNTCVKSICGSCGSELPESTMPDGEDFERSEEEIEREKLKAQAQKLQNALEQAGIDIE